MINIWNIDVLLGRYRPARASQNFVSEFMVYKLEYCFNLVYWVLSSYYEWSYQSAILCFVQLVYHHLFMEFMSGRIAS